MSEVRQRTTRSMAAEKDTSSAPAAASLVKEEDRSKFTVLEVLRTITLILLLSGLASWFVTRDNVAWGLKRPRATHLSYWQSLLAAPILLTDAELGDYDGSDPTKPIYLAVNGTIYDVTDGRRFYGPGGSYHQLGGADCSRALVTTCFNSDISPDLRGIEKMFLPKSTPQVDAQYTAEEMAALQEEELKIAKEKAYKALKHWVDFFANHKKYVKVGTVKREKGWETKGEAPELCQNANNARPFRKPPVKKT
ncbi:hypothetical protein V495_03007 [Pseudogymnoascus sp. VKM F-4514 (FW-929)]|nr:hypothetical protein V490_04963 [Pseudogymnoascus sp. VKM F-3557]KFY45373.1 hypothetical protein V495_03007 [Pseudogymnoascus sp. VKM F-4514 (FW-929)]KFY51787.1 hypothetical protein V497_08854 [Pseudogymnoascus sp. VKM F-4516 (FW-969)]